MIAVAGRPRSQRCAYVPSGVDVKDHSAILLLRTEPAAEHGTGGRRRGRGLSRSDPRMLARSTFREDEMRAPWAPGGNSRPGAERNRKPWRSTSRAVINRHGPDVTIARRQFKRIGRLLLTGRRPCTAGARTDGLANADGSPNQGRAGERAGQFPAGTRGGSCLPGRGRCASVSLPIHRPRAAHFSSFSPRANTIAASRSSEESLRQSGCVIRQHRQGHSCRPPWAWRESGVRGLGLRPQPAHAVDETELLKLDVGWSAGMSLSLIDSARAAQIFVQNLIQGLRAGDLLRTTRPLLAVASLYAVRGTGGLRRYGQLLQQAEQWMAQSEDPHLQALYYMVRGLAAYAQGQWSLSLKLNDQSAALFRDHCTGVTLSVELNAYYALRAGLAGKDQRVALAPLGVAQRGSGAAGPLRDDQFPHQGHDS